LAEAKGGQPDVILIGTGSELSLCVAAYEQLAAEGVRARLVSMPSWHLFDEQDEAYRKSVLPPNVTARVAVEAGVEQGWEKYLGFIGMTTFGASAPASDLFKHFGFTVDHVVSEAKALVAKR
jgi:transketolase